MSGFAPVAASAAAGLSAAMARFERASETLIDATSRHGEDGDAARAIADQIEAKAAARANIAVLRVHDEMLGGLLDITA